MKDLAVMHDFLRMESESAPFIESFVMPDGINIWPHLRVAFYADLMFESGEYRRNNCESNPGVCDYHYELFPKMYRSLLHIPRKSCLVFTMSSFHTEKVQGKAYDPYLDPVVMLANEADLLPVKIVFDSCGIENAFVPPLYLARYEEKRFIPWSKLPPIPGYNEYVDAALRYRIPVLHRLRVLQAWKECSAYAEFFEKILSLTQPRLVILECYYCMEYMGLAQACRKLHIPCVEYQHGMQKTPHVPYCFSYLPKHGYEVIPEYFFHWGELPAQEMRQRFAKQNFHKALAAGQPQYLAWKRNLRPEPENVLRNFKHKLDGRIPVCVAFPLFEAFDLLEEVIALAPPEWLWLLRQHPLRKDERCGRLIGNWPDRAETVGCNCLSLHTVLQNSRHLVTGYSSCVDEAIFLHTMKTTCLLKAGAEYYPHHIDAGLMNYAADPESVLQSVAKGIAGYPQEFKGTSGIATDTSLLAKALRKVCAENSSA